MRNRECTSTTTVSKRNRRPTSQQRHSGLCGPVLPPLSKRQRWSNGHFQNLRLWVGWWLVPRRVVAMFRWTHLIVNGTILPVGHLIKCSHGTDYVATVMKRRQKISVIVGCSPF